RCQFRPLVIRAVLVRNHARNVSTAIPNDSELRIPLFEVKLRAHIDANYHARQVSPDRTPPRCHPPPQAGSGLSVVRSSSKWLGGAEAGLSPAESSTEGSEGSDMHRSRLCAVLI